MLLLVLILLTSTSAIQTHRKLVTFLNILDLFVAADPLASSVSGFQTNTKVNTLLILILLLALIRWVCSEWHRPKERSIDSLNILDPFAGADPLRESFFSSLRRFQSWHEYWGMVWSSCWGSSPLLTGGWLRSSQTSRPRFLMHSRLSHYKYFQRPRMRSV